VYNQVGPQLLGLAYNLGKLPRCSALLEHIDDWSLKTLSEKLIKTGTKVVIDAHFMFFLLAETASPERPLWKTRVESGGWVGVALF
jgi:hypothetical protein